MALRRGFSYGQIDGNPLLPIQAGRVDPLTRAGVASGQVFCPQRGAHIAVMRCGEYQDRFGCGRGAIHRAPCPNAVSAKLIKETKTHARSALGAKESYECPVCHDPVKSAGARCHSCATLRNRALRRHRNVGARSLRNVGARFIAPERKKSKRNGPRFGVCIACGNPKKSYVGTRCKSCASRDPARRHPHKTARHNKRVYRGGF